MITLKKEKLNTDIKNALHKLEISNNEDSILIDDDGHRFVVLKEHDYLSWKETSYLLSTDTNRKIIQDSLAEGFDKCKDLEDILNDLEG